jgi:hypothetical protein
MFSRTFAVMFFCGLFIFTALGTTPAAMAGVIYFVRAADTSDGAIGDGIIASMKALDLLITRMKELAKLDVKVIDIKDARFSCNEINASVSALNTKSDDVVVFYYLGHGFESVSTDLFPEFDCLHFKVGAGFLSDTDSSSAKLSEIVSVLQNKPQKPRLIVALADSCNRRMKVSPQAPLAAEGQALFALGLDHLFTGFAGTIIIAGARQQEDAFYWLSGDTAGGLFTSQFMDAISSEVQSNQQNADWGPIIKDATSPIILPTNAPIGAGVCYSPAGAPYKCQHPFASYQIRVLNTQGP